MIVPGRLVVVSTCTTLYDRRWMHGDDRRVFRFLDAHEEVLVLAVAEADPALRDVWALVLPRTGTPGWAMLPAPDRP